MLEWKGEDRVGFGWRRVLVRVELRGGPARRRDDKDGLKDEEDDRNELIDLLVELDAPDVRKRVLSPPNALLNSPLGALLVPAAATETVPKDESALLIIVG